MLRKPTRYRVLTAATWLLAVMLVSAAVIGAQQSKRSKPRPKITAPQAVSAPVAPPPPFHAGEVLEYRVLFSKYAVNAAKVETSVVEQRNFFGHPAWHFRADAHTMDTTRLLFPLDDEFDSYTAVARLVSLQYEMYLHEQGKAQTALYRMTSDAEPAPQNVTALRAAPGTLDAVGFLYALRAADWQRAPELRAPVFDGRLVYDVLARMDTPQGTVNVPAGNLPASRIAIRLFERGKEITDTRLWLWIAKDAAHTPVLIEAEIPIGTCRVELLHLP